MPERAVPGSPIKPNLTAEWYNSTLDKGPPPEKKRGKDQRFHNELIAVFQPSVLHPTINRFEPVGIINRADEYGNRESRTSIVTKEDLNQTNWIIAQAKMEAGMLSQPCVYAGLTWAKVTILDASHQYVRLDEDTLTLVSDNIGKGMLLVVGVEYSLISIEGLTITSWLLKTIETVTGRVGMQLGSGACNIIAKTDNFGGIVDTGVQIVAYNSQIEEVEADLIVQAKNWLGLPLIDVVPC